MPGRLPGTVLAADRFETFGDVHLALLAVFAVGAVAVVLLGRRLRGRDSALLVSRVLAVLLVAVTVPSQVYQLLPAQFDLSTSLPLQLCDLAWIAAVWALWTQGRVPTALTYFWGLTLTVQGVLTPSLAEAFPDPLFLAFWGLHFLVVFAALFLTLGLGLGPRWREYAVTVGVTASWAVLVYAFNTVTGVNYGYLNRKPRSASLFDYLGPPPFYVLAALVVVVSVWALMTWPWMGRLTRCEPPTPSSRSGRPSRP